MIIGQAGALWMPVPAQIIFPNYYGHKPKWVVIHKTASAGTAQNIAEYFGNLNENTEWSSAHYVVGTDGTIVQCVSESEGAGANGILESGHAAFLPTDVNLNCLTISIEHCDASPENATPLTPAQQEASFRLVKGICQRHNIPMRAGDASGGILGHNQIAPIDRAHCPGNYPFDALYAYLQSNQGEETPMLQLTDPMGRYFTAVDNDRWHCAKTGQDLAYALLTFYRQYNGVFGLPISGEIYLQQYPNTALQYCERALMVYDPERKIDSPDGAGDCYLLHLDKGIGQQAVAKPLIAALQGQVDTLTKQVADLTRELDAYKAQPANTLDLEAQIAALEKQLGAYKQAIVQAETTLANVAK